MHSAIWAGLVTGVFAAIYLYFAYGVKPPLPDISFDNTETYVRNTQVTNTGLQSETIQKDTENTNNISVFSSIKDIINIFKSANEDPEYTRQE